MTFAVIKNVFFPVEEFSTDYKMTPLSDSPQHDHSVYHLLGLKALHDIRMNGEGVRIAIIEQGCNRSHAAFQSKSNDDFNLYNCPNRTEKDINHGTAVCGIAAGEVIIVNDADNHPVTVCGVAPRAKVTVVGYSGSLTSFYDALAYISSRPVPYDVVSISQGSHGPVEADTRDKIKRIISSMGSTIFLAASGNIGNKDKVPFPALLSNVISIGSLDARSAKPVDLARDDGIDVYCYGDNLAAPWGSNSNLSGVTGSSMATPVAAGLTALAIQCARQRYNYRLSQEKVEDMLKHGMRARGSTYDMKPAEFLLDALRDVSYFKNLTPREP